MIPTKLKKAACPVCQNPEATFFVRKNDCNLFRCQKCSLIFVHPILDKYRDIYQSTYLEGKNELQHAGDAEAWEATTGTFQSYLEKIEKFQPGKGKIFDVGSATGLFIEMAAKRGWDASGIEISKGAAETGRRKGLNIDQGNFEIWSGETGFDAVTFWDVLEHFLRPDLAVQNARIILRKGGLLAINAPDSRSILLKILGKRWHHLNPPSHLHYFNLVNLQNLLERNDFEIVYSGRIGKKFTLRQIFKLLAMWQGLSLWKATYSFLSRNRLGELKIPINTRDNFFVLARKIGSEERHSKI